MSIHYYSMPIPWEMRRQLPSWNASSSRFFIEHNGLAYEFSKGSFRKPRLLAKHRWSGTSWVATRVWGWVAGGRRGWSR